RLQLQERLTVQIAEALRTHLAPHGVAVSVEARHLCMAARGIQKQGTTMKTFHYTGEFERCTEQRRAFLSQIGRGCRTKSPALAPTCLQGPRAVGGARSPRHRCGG